MMPKLTLYMRHGCHLCEDMHRDLLRMPEADTLELQLVDIDSKAELQARYGTRIPVLMAGEREICHYTLDPVTLREFLAENA